MTTLSLITPITNGDHNSPLECISTFSNPPHFDILHALPLSLDRFKRSRKLHDELRRSPRGHPLGGSQSQIGQWLTARGDNPRPWMITHHIRIKPDRSQRTKPRSPARSSVSYSTPSLWELPAHTLTIFDPVQILGDCSDPILVSVNETSAPTHIRAHRTVTVPHRAGARECRSPGSSICQPLLTS
jgi:hypothetical protein